MRPIRWPGALATGMKLGICPMQGATPYDELIEIARFADGNGFASVLFQEHHEDPDQHWPDPLTDSASSVSEAVGWSWVVLRICL